MEPTPIEPRLNGRSEDQILGAAAGHVRSGLAVTLGGETRYIRPLSIAAMRKWKERVNPVVSEAGTAAFGIDPASLETPQGVAALLAADNIDVVLDLLVAYDELGGSTLGVSRDWLEGNATASEVRTVLEVLLDSAYPPQAGSGQTAGRHMIDLLQSGAAARSLSALSTKDSSHGTGGSGVRRASKKS